MKTSTASAASVKPAVKQAASAASVKPAVKQAADPALAALGATLMYKRPVAALPEGGFRITVDVTSTDDLAKVLLMLRGI